MTKKLVIKDASVDVLVPLQETSKEEVQDTPKRSKIAVIESRVKEYYFSVVGVVDKNGDEIKDSFPSSNLDFNCTWDLDTICDRAASRFYLNPNNEIYKDISKWPLTFKFYTNRRSAPIYQTNIFLNFCPTFTRENNHI